MHPPQLGAPSLKDTKFALLTEAWGWRELDSVRCCELLDTAGRLADSEALMLRHSAEFRAASLVVLGYLSFREARQAEALECSGQALALLADHTGSFWFSRALNVRSCALLELAEFEQATLSLRQQLRVSRANGDTDREICLIPASAHGTDAVAAVTRLDRAAVGAIRRQTDELGPVRRAVDSFIR
mgnify:CR=1 FL=1